MQGKNCDTDVEKKRMDTNGGRRWRGGSGGEMNWEIEIDIYTLICTKWITNKNLLYKKKTKFKTNKQTNGTKLNLKVLHSKGNHKQNEKRKKEEEGESGRRRRDSALLWSPSH